MSIHDPVAQVMRWFLETTEIYFLLFARIVYSHLISSGLVDTGFSIAARHRI